MKKAGIIAGMVIWSLVAVRYICKANEKKTIYLRHLQHQIAIM